jgi:hypothetical protein
MFPLLCDTVKVFTVPPHVVGAVVVVVVGGGGAAVVVVVAGGAVVGGVVVVAADGAVVVVELVGTGATVVLVGSVDWARQLAGWGRWDTQAELLATSLEAVLPAILIAPSASPPTSAVSRAYSTNVAPRSRRPLRESNFFMARTSTTSPAADSDWALPARNGHRRLSFQRILPPWVVNCEKILAPPVSFRPVRAMA